MKTATRAQVEDAEDAEDGPAVEEVPIPTGLVDGATQLTDALPARSAGVTISEWRCAQCGTEFELMSDDLVINKVVPCKDCPACGGVRTVDPTKVETLASWCKARGD